MSRIAALLAGVALSLPGTAFAAPDRVAASDSFRIGDAGVLCTAQRRSEDDRYGSMFDRGYDVVCRDAATPVGRLYVMKAAGDAAAKRFAAGTPQDVVCQAPAPATVAGFADASKAECRDENGLNRVLYMLTRGGTFYAVEGLAAYQSALDLGFAAIVADRPVSGEVTVATTNAGDPAAFAKVQAASLDPAQALAAGYRRNVEGSFAEASQYFEALSGRSRASEAGADKAGEYLANDAIQQSNMGNAAEADRLFAEAERAAPSADPLFGRLFRNLKAMHRLNQQDAAGALEILEKPVPPVSQAAGSTERLAEGFIDNKLSQRLATDDDAMTKLGGGSSQLTENERGALLDAQAQYLTGVALRIKGDRAGAKAGLSRGLAGLAAVRSGMVRSMNWMAAGAATELAQIALADGDAREAEAQLRNALAIYRTDFPESATLLGARARLAALQADHGQRAEAIATYRELVRDAARIPGGGEALRALIKPYFDALVEEQGASAANDFFVASQAMVRPGVAQTQATFAREMSGGSDEASALFRQSVTLTREIVSTDVEIARLSGLESRTAQQDEALTAAQGRRAQAGAAQTALLAKLGDFPKFRVMANPAIELAGLQATLGPDEGYYKLLLVGDAAYGIMIRPSSARIVKVAATKAELEAMTNTIRDSIVVEEANQLTTNPFDLVTSHKMFTALFGGVSDDLNALKHLVFEPDGPLLKLPVNVLVTDQASVDRYAEAQKGDNPDEFDFTGTAWLGREHLVSTATSAQSFADLRKIAPSKAKRRYLGVGQNAKIANAAWAPKSEDGRDPCDWGLSLWNKPISGAELRLASQLLGGTGNEVIVEDGYSDTMLRERADLRDFRIIQFATHGLVTAPKPGCPARPALVTSFGERESDGLLSFKEIFDLRLDADTIILSACDTAGAATLSATREAGIETGGNFALDGLVRAFVGAGARTVIASHWPVPDDYDATKRLMSKIYEGGTHQAVGESMRLSQNALMDDPLTSHPYYWAAFAIVGDARKPLTSDAAPAQIAESGQSSTESLK